MCIKKININNLQVLTFDMTPKTLTLIFQDILHNKRFHSQIVIFYFLNALTIYIKTKSSISNMH